MGWAPFIGWPEPALITDLYKIPVWTSLGVIAAILTVAMAVSWRRSAGDESVAAVLPMGTPDDSGHEGRDRSAM